VTDTKAELRARAEALAAEYDAPLPDGDVGLIEAERRFRDFRAGEKALYRDFRITIEAEGIVNPIIEPVRLRLWGFIEQTPPIGLAGAAAKLRLLTDKDLGLSAEISEGEDTNLKQVGEFVEREAGATANPGEVAAPALTDDVIEETFEVVTSMGTISWTRASLPMGLPFWQRTRSRISSSAQCLCGSPGGSRTIVRRSKRGAASFSDCCTPTANILRKRGWPEEAQP